MESIRETNLKKSLFVLSNAVASASASRLAKAEEIAATEGETTAEQTREWADLVVEENRKVSEYSLAESDVAREENVVKTRRNLVEEN